jgi:hypothetical protein
MLEAGHCYTTWRKEKSLGLENPRKDRGEGIEDDVCFR